MRPVPRNDPKYTNKLSNSNNVSPSKNFFSQNQSSSLIRALISADHTPSRQQSSSKSPFMRHNNPYQRYLVPSSVHKVSQTESKKSKSYISSDASLKQTVNNSTPTQYTAEDDHSTIKKRPEHKRQISKVVVPESYSRPDSGLSKKSTQANTQISTSAQSLIQRIREQQLKKPISQQSQLLNYHQELIDKQYKKLLELQQQHYQTFKKKTPAASKGAQQPAKLNPDDVSSQLIQYIKNQSAKKQKGYRSISNPDIASQVQKRLSYISKTAVLTEAGRLHTGQVKTNQDSFFLKENLMGKPNCWLLQVSDGHGTNGHQVAQYVREKLPQFIEFQLKQKKIAASDFASEETNSPSLSSTALKLAFERTTRELYTSGIDITFSGATTVTVMVLENEVWCANIGDSRAIIARAIDHKQYQVMEISRDHKPDTPSEFKRIMQNGGRVQPYSDQDGNPVGPARVWLREDNIPGLAMSRSFGDYVASQVGVISQPEVMKHTLRPQDKFMVVASDGIWEFLSNEWIINTVAEYYRKGDPEGACQRLVEEAIQAWEREDEVIDDITCIVAFIGQEGFEATCDKF